MDDDHTLVVEWADMTSEQRRKLWEELDQEIKLFAPTVENMFNEMITRVFKAPIRVEADFRLKVLDVREDPRL